MKPHDSSLISSYYNEISERINRTHLNEEKQNSYTETLFESIKHINEYGNEFWYARELQKALEYNQWRRFEEVIERAKNACKNSGNIISEHFANVGKSSPMPNGGERIIDDYALSRYACYLIVQNGDSRKKVIALGQTYFAVKTRQQELIENFDDLSEDKKRLAIRNEMKTHNKSLAEAANQTHYEVGKKVRQTIKELGGTMPEDLPTPSKGIKQIEREQRKITD